MKIRRVPSISKSLTETVRFPQYGSFSADYEVVEGKSVVGKARVTDGIIEVLACAKEFTPRVQHLVLGGMLNCIIHDADRSNANLSIQIVNERVIQLKRFFERFGFKPASDRVFKRLAGSIHPPAVI